MAWINSPLASLYESFFAFVLIVLAVGVLLCLIKAIAGPRIADRIVAINMIGTMVIIAIAVLAVMLSQSYLADVSLIYAMLSFLAVIVLTKVFMGVYAEKQRRKEQNKKEDPHA